MSIHKPPVLKELLQHRKETNASYIDVCKLTPNQPDKSKPLYRGLDKETPEDILNLPISGWSKKDGIYITE